MHFPTFSVAKFIWKLRLRPSGKKIIVTLTSWKMSRSPFLFPPSELHSWGSPQLAEGALLKLRRVQHRFA